MYFKSNKNKSVGGINFETGQINCINKSTYVLKIF